MKMKLVFSLVLSLIFIIALSSPTSAYIPGNSLSYAGSVAGGDSHGGGHGGDGGGGGNGEDGGGNGEDGGGHDGGGGSYGGGGSGDDGGNGWDYEQHEFVEADAEALWQTDPPEGQELGDVQNIRDFNGDIIVTEDGVPLLGRQIFYKETGEPVLDYSEYREGEPIYITNVGRVSVPVTYFLELGPGFRSGPGYEGFAYTPPPGAPPPSETPDDQTQETPSPAPIPEPENQDGELSPSETFRDDTQFGEPQPVMNPTGSSLVDEGGATVLGRAVLDEEGNSVIGPNGKPIIVIPD